MKHTKSLLIAALAALSIGSATAETIYITGSTAFRGSANAAIGTYSTNNGGQIIAQDTAALGSAGNLLASYVSGGVTNLIDVHWSGSEAGIQSVAGPATGTNAALIGFFATNATGTNSAANNSASTNNTNNQVAQLSFSDTFQSTSQFNGTLSGISYSALSGFDGADGEVGVVSFNWIGSANIPASNITANLANALFSAGKLPLALLTGSAADQTNGVYLFGRNFDSGTRLTTLVEVGYGTKTPIKQYKFNSTNNIQLYPIESIDGISSSSLGNSGYSSGGTLVGLFTNALAKGSGLVVNTNGATSAYTGTNFLIGYASTSDANGQIINGLVKLAYDGVTVSTNTIIQGQYTFWGYEHLYVSPSADAAAKAVATGIGTGLLATPTSTLTPNVNLNDLLVGRTLDGGPVFNTAY